ncbi:MAG: hypothetical protein ACJ76B_07875 [Solirubrobacterales bacterium]
MEAACAVCGRTILAGERVHEFAEGGEERPVCELCVARAGRLGWRPAAEPEVERRQEHEGRRRLRRLWRPRPTPARPRPAPAPAIADETGLTPFERAVARFGSSEAGRAVAGLTRTLGRPKASVGASAGAPDLVRVTVAWELTWYQWGVDVADELRPVFELGKGGEIDQLDAAAKQWNALVGEDGRLRLAGERAPSR